MKLKLILTLAAFAFALQTSFGQKLLIEYDYLKDNINYYKVKKSGQRVVIPNATVQRNHQVKVEIINFNPHLYTAKVDFSTSSIAEESNIGFMNLISPLGLSGMGSSFLSSLTTSETSVRGGLMSDPKASSSYAAVQSSYNQLAEVENTINSLKYVTERLYKLKYNPYLPGDSIKVFSKRMVEGLLNKPNVQTQDFISLGMQINNVVASNYSDLQASVQRFDGAYNKYANTRGKGGGFEGEGLNTQAAGLFRAASQFNENFDYDQVVQYLDVLELTYQSIVNTSYTYNTSEMANGDKLSMDITIFKIPVEGDDASSATEVKTKSLDITVKGDLKINSSVGLSFPFYANNVSYINKDSVITEVDGENYTPNISAYINFYPYSGKIGQLGGTFGVGVPISSTSRNFNFLFGGSAILGTKNKVVLHAGATLGQVKKLDNALVTGDYLQNSYDEVPTISSYNWGGFVGISFSIANLKN
ncbi:MAG: hypothetical protein ACPGTP_04805 [Bacteroidia bacterium]